MRVAFTYDCARLFLVEINPSKKRTIIAAQNAANTNYNNVLIKISLHGVSYKV